MHAIDQITLPTPFPVGPVHAYLLHGEPLTLLDTGPCTPQAEAALRAGLAAHGIAFSDIERIVISHSHADHYGLVGPIAAAGHAEVWTHPLAHPIIEAWNDYLEPRASFILDVLLAAAVPAEQAQLTAQLYGAMRTYTTAAPVTHLLAEGDTLEMADATWQVLHCPGHAADLLCFFQPEAHLLLGNDHLLRHISSNAVLSPPDLGETQRRQPLVDYWHSLARVAALPVNTVLPGHGEIVTDPLGVIAQRRNLYERRLTRLADEIKKGPRTAWQLAQTLFRSLDDADTFLAVSEVIGHLDVLQNDGVANLAVDAAGVEWFQATHSST
ncbi:MAG: MBL fold metallo-hydrolase [Caldilineales bacterium]